MVTFYWLQINFFFSETKICKVTQLFGTCTSMTESCGVQTSVIHILEEKSLYIHINALFKATVFRKVMIFHMITFNALF